MKMRYTHSKFIRVVIPKMSKIYFMLKYDFRHTNTSSHQPSQK